MQLEMLRCYIYRIREILHSLKKIKPQERELFDLPGCLQQTVAPPLVSPAEQNYFFILKRLKLRWT